MKITGGEFKGRLLKVPKMADIRPSTEKIREAIFSALGADIIDADVADLFCGSGALGMEALSRGARSALFVDQSASAGSTVKENIRILKLDKYARVLVMNALTLRRSHLDKIGIIFADPPYKKGYAQKFVSLISLPNYAWYGILALEHEPMWRYDGDYFKLVKRIDFGDTSVSFLIRLNADTQTSVSRDGKDNS
jgi:16S rRNA (guanine966-N2)-methyltransferase